MQGLDDLRLVIADYLKKYNNNNFKKEDIIIGPGTKELMFLTQIVFQGEVLLPAPSWVSYKPQSIIAKNNYNWIQTDLDKAEKVLLIWRRQYPESISPLRELSVLYMNNSNYDKAITVFNDILKTQLLVLLNHYHDI